MCQGYVLLKGRYPGPTHRCPGNILPGNVLEATLETGKKKTLTCPLGMSITSKPMCGSCLACPGSTGAQNIFLQSTFDGSGGSASNTWCFRRLARPFSPCETENAIRARRAATRGKGIDLRDGLKHLLDPRFADDILMFVISAKESRLIPDSLMSSFDAIVLILKADKTVIMTTEAPCQHLVTNRGDRTNEDQC